MPLTATHEAIGAVSEALRAQLELRTSLLVTVSRPDTAAEAESAPKLNLFLYQIDFDPHLKNHSLQPGEPAPLWLVLRYLVTAFDSGQDSDSIAAHRLLARGLAGLQEMSMLWPTVPALLDNPEPLKLTFDAADTELLSRLMQGSDEKFRISAAFQVRPVLIAPDIFPELAPPVLTVGPPGAEGVVVLPTLGPRLKRITPARFEAGALIELSGDDINSGIDQVHLGPIDLPVIAAREGAVQARVPALPALSAGDHAVAVSRPLPSGRRMASNLLAATLLPTITAAAIGPLTPSGPGFTGTATITGQRLGGVDDAVFVAFYRDGTVRLNLEVSGTAAQTTLVVTIDAAHALPAGRYYLIVRVNGAQATRTPEAAWLP
jgi:hypothetical protein